jgi:hypothetical protein
MSYSEWVIKNPSFKIADVEIDKRLWKWERLLP